MALYLAFCGALAGRGVFIHASVINAFAGLLRGVALLLRVVSMRGAAFAALLLFGLPGYLLQLCCFAAGGPRVVPSANPPGALPPVVLLFAVSVLSVGGPRFGAPSGRWYLFGVLRTLCGLCAVSLIGAGAASLLGCWGCWGPSEGPRAVGRLRGGPACYPRRGRKKSGHFLKSVRTEFSRRFLGPTLNLHRLRATILKLRRLKKLKIFPIRAHTKGLKKSPKKSAALETGRG